MVLIHAGTTCLACLGKIQWHVHHVRLKHARGDLSHTSLEIRGGWSLAGVLCQSWHLRTAVVECILPCMQMCVIGVKRRPSPPLACCWRVNLSRQRCDWLSLVQEQVSAIICSPLQCDLTWLSINNLGFETPCLTLDGAELDWPLAELDPTFSALDPASSVLDPVSADTYQQHACQHVSKHQWTPELALDGVNGRLQRHEMLVCVHCDCGIAKLPDWEWPRWGPGFGVRLRSTFRACFVCVERSSQASFRLVYAPRLSTCAIFFLRSIRSRDNGVLCTCT